MGAEIDSLEIAVKTTVDEANRSLDGLIKKLGLAAEGLAAMTKNSGLSDFSKKISDLSKNDGLGKSIQSLGDVRKAADAGSKLGKTFADNIIRGYKIQDKNVQASIREMTQGLAKMSIGEIASGMENPEFLSTFDKLGETVSKNARILQSRMGIYDDFYKYFQGLGKIEIPNNVVAELGDDWKGLQKTAPKTFSRNGSGIELDSVYQEMSDKFKDIFSGTADQTQQFREIVSALQNYRADIDKLQPVDQSKITGFEDGMWDDLYQSLSEMRHKITDQLSGLKVDLAKSAEEIREQYQDLGKDFTMQGSEKQIENKISSLTNSLENAKLKQQELETSGKTSGSSYETAISNVIKYENQIESLKAQLESLKEAERQAAEEAANVASQAPAKSTGPNPDVFTGTITGIGFDAAPEIEEAKRSVQVAVSNMQYNAEAMKATFGEAAGNIRDWAQAVAEYGAMAGQALNSSNPDVFKTVSSSAAEAKQQVAGLSSEIQNMNNLLSQTVSDVGSGGLFENVFSGVGSGIKGALGKLPAIATTAFRGVVSAAKAIMKPMMSLASMVTKPFTAAFKKLTGASNGTHKSFLKNFLTIAKYAIGVRSLYTLINKLRSAFVAGMKNLVQYSSETNASVSLLMNSVTQLKNSVAAAASPLLNALAPALNAIIQMCINAANAINQLFSALTGHGTWIKATKQTKDYAKSLGGASKAADDLKTHTLGIDELNVVDQNSNSSSGGSGSGTSAADMFETVDIDSKWKDWSDKIKSMWQMGDFTELGSAIGSWLKGGLDSINWDGIQESARRIASSIGTFINGFVETEGLGTTIGTTLGQALNTAVDFANTLLDVTHWDSIGKFIGDGLNGVVNAVQWDEIGQMLGGGVNAALDAIDNVVTTFDWKKFGDSIGGGLNTALETVNWEGIGKTGSDYFIGCCDFWIAGIRAVNWSDFGANIVDGILAVDWGGCLEELVTLGSDICIAILDFCNGAIREVNWIELAHNATWELLNVVGSVDWNGIISRGFELFGLVLGGFGAVLTGICQALWEMLVQGFNSTKAYFNAYITAAGGDIVQGLFNGIIAALASIGAWINTNIFQPFYNAFCDAFGIHSPSRVMAEMGGYLIEGLFNGIREGWERFKNGVVQVATGIINKFKDVLGIHSPSTVMDEQGVYLVEGLKNGINGTMDDVYNLFTRSKWEELGQGMHDGLIAPFTTGERLGVITTFANNAVQVVSDTLSAQTFQKIGTDAVSSLANGFTLTGLKNVFMNIKTALQNVWSETTTWWSGTAMPSFFSVNVSPWFTSAKWKTATDGMRSGIIAKWDEFVGQWRTRMTTWWNSNVKPWFEKSKWQGEGENMKTALLEKWAEFSSQWDTNITEWFNSKVSAWFTKEKWQPFGENMKNGLYEGFKGIAEQVGNLVNGMIDTMNKGLSNLTDALNDLIDRYNNVADDVGGDELGHINYSDAHWVDLPAYKAGGFPEDGLFFANHSEMVGQFSNGKTAVANNEQIVAGIAAGVREAVAEVLAPYLSAIEDNTRETANKNTSISIDGRELVTAINNRISRNGFSFT